MVSKKSGKVSVKKKNLSDSKKGPKAHKNVDKFYEIDFTKKKGYKVESKFSKQKEFGFILVFFELLLILGMFIGAVGFFYIASALFFGLEYLTSFLFISLLLFLFYYLSIKTLSSINRNKSILIGYSIFTLWYSLFFFDYLIYDLFGIFSYLLYSTHFSIAILYSFYFIKSKRIRKNFIN